MSIRRKLTLMTMAISVMAVAIAVTAVTMYLIYDMRKSKIESVALIAKIAGDRNSAALAFRTKDSIQNNLEIYHLSPSIRAVCIYNEYGELFGSYVPDSSEQNDLCTSDFAHLPKTLQDLITVRDDIWQNSSLIGHIYVVSDTREIDSFIARITQISLSVTAVTLTLIFFTAVYFSGTLSRAILELTSTIQSIITSKNYSLTAKTNYNDEIGILAKEFNIMLGEALKRDRELAEANERLEEKICQRTRELMDAKQKAEMASEAKSEFLRNMSHEFRTPLHAILSFSSYGTKEYKSSKREELKKYFELINRGSERLSKLVNEVLDLAQMERRTMSFSRQSADLRDLANRAYEMITPLIEEKNIDMRIENSEDVIETICDPDKIIQVIINMLSNAVKFTPPGKSITLRTQQVDGMAVLSVTDDGIGIPEDEIEAIFESFRQSSRTNAGTGGTGLGLAICREIIEAHQGIIWAANNRNAPGACVTFSVPSALSGFTTTVIAQYPEESHDTALKV